MTSISSPQAEASASAEEETDEVENYGEELQGDIIPPAKLINGELELPELLGGIIFDPDCDEDEDESEE